MPEPQRIGSPLVEENLALEPATPSRMVLSTFVQRAWSLLFGRRKNTLRALYAGNGGALGVAPIPLTDMKYVGSAAITTTTWIDIGELVDVVVYQADADAISHTFIEGSVNGTNAVCSQAPQQVSVQATPGADFAGGFCGILHARVRYIRFAGLVSATDKAGKWAAYAYIDN